MLFAYSNLNSVVDSTIFQKLVVSTGVVGDALNEFYSISKDMFKLLFCKIFGLNTERFSMIWKLTSTGQSQKNLSTVIRWLELGKNGNKHLNENELNEHPTFFLWLGIFSTFYLRHSETDFEKSHRVFIWKVRLTWIIEKDIHSLSTDNSVFTEYKPQYWMKIKNFCVFEV